jgi:hypothetical protein
MKILNIYYIAGALLLLTFASCKKDLLKANTNPTQSTAGDYDPNLLLTEVQLNYTGSQAGEDWYTEWGGLGGFIQQTASLDGFYPGDKYLNSTFTYGDYFDQQYTASVQPVVELYQLTANNAKYANLHQIARLMKALVFERITDLYGDVPYFQAGLGYYDRIYAPVYDKQQDIYTDLLKEVSQATDSLNLSGDTPTGDVFYHSTGAKNQISEWKKFGNSLLLRIAMRLTKVDPTTAQTYVAKVKGLTMTDNTDNAIVEHSAQSDETFNRDAQTILGNDSSGLKLGRMFVDTLQANKDPRLHVIAYIFRNHGKSDSTSKHQMGLPGGCVQGGLNPAVNIAIRDSANWAKKGIYGYSTINSNLLNINAPTLVLTYAETELLLADAAARWGSISDAKTHYNNGVSAAITQLSAYGSGATINSGISEYLAAHPLSSDSQTALGQINYEYWVSTFMDEYEAWCNWRRVDNSTTQKTLNGVVGEGYPTLYPTHYPGNITNSTIPRRLNYPTDQKITNAANYQAAVARIGGDLLTIRMWWDKE